MWISNGNMFKVLTKLLKIKARCCHNLFFCFCFIDRLRERETDHFTCTTVIKNDKNKKYKLGKVIKSKK